MAIEATEMTIQCECGALVLTATDVHPAVANRVVCGCRGCQAFAQRMDPGLLDAHGGTERCQIDPSCLRIVRGAAQLACLQQTPGGALRWYAACCDTPIGLTLTTSRVPFVGIDVRRIDRGELSRPLAEVLGPVRARVNTAMRGDVARDHKADARSLLAMLWHLAPLILRWWWRGAQRRSPFFDAESGQPTSKPARLYSTRPALLNTAGCR